jgi:hypothetical protein
VPRHSTCSSVRLPASTRRSAWRSISWRSNPATVSTSWTSPRLDVVRVLQHRKRPARGVLLSGGHRRLDGEGVTDGGLQLQQLLSGRFRGIRGPVCAG